MSERKISIPVQGILVNGKTVTQLQGECMLPTCCPFTKLDIPELSTALVNPAQYSGTSVSQEFSFSLPSSDHLRSVEVVCNQKKFYWEDEYGNLFSSLNVKGNNLEDPVIYMADIAPSGCMVFGLMDSDAILRVHRASAVMRKAGIDTEYDVRTIEPLELPLDGKRLSQPDFKKALLDRVLKGQKPKGTQLGYDLATSKDINKVAGYLNNTIFYFTARAGQTAARYADLAKARNMTELKELLAPAFQFTNEQKRRQSPLGRRKKEDLNDIDNLDDIKTYLLLELPARVVKNYAKLHDADLVHIYSHLGNQSTVGSIYDLDSIKGKPLGLEDEEVLPEEIAGDIINIYDRVLDVTKGINENTKIFEQDTTSGAFTFVSRCVLLLTYMRERKTAKGFIHMGNVVEQLALQMTNSEKEVESFTQSDFLRTYLHRASEEAGLRYRLADEDFVPLLQKALHELPVSPDHLLRNLQRLVGDSTASIVTLLLPALEEDMRSKHVDKIQKLTETFGKERVDTFIRLSCLYEATDAMTFIDKDLIPPLSLMAMEKINASLGSITQQLRKEVDRFLKERRKKNP